MSSHNGKDMIGMVSEDMRKQDDGSRLPNVPVSFNPSDPKSVDAILSQFGPEGAYEIAEVLRKAADEDVTYASCNPTESDGTP